MESRDSPRHLPAGSAVPSKRGQVAFGHAMELDFPCHFGDALPGQRLNMVASLLCWDPTHDAHLFTSVVDETKFLANGLMAQAVGSHS